MFSLVSYYLADTFKTYVFTNIIDNLSNKTNNISIDSLEDTLKKADDLGIDYLVCRSFGNKDDYDLLKNYKTKIVIWSHNFSKFKELNWISNSNSVIKYVCVGKHQFDLLNGHPIYKKATYIFNGLPIYAYKIDEKNSNKAICYVGSIIKGKGFDTCCKVWRELYDNGYKVDFNIIGSAKLYNSSKTLGKYGIASPEYEQEFIKYLIDDDGKLIKQVKLYGVLGHKEKIDVINKSYLGLSASEEETFGLIALEFALLGKPFVALETCGYKDIVINGKTGFIVKNEDELYDMCVKILSVENQKYMNMSDNSTVEARKFDIKTLANDWKNLFIGLNKNEELLNRNERIGLFKRIYNIIGIALNKR